MIDTLDIGIEIKLTSMQKAHQLQSHLYTILDNYLIQHNLTQLHKNPNQKRSYITNGLANYGFLNINFFHTNYKYGVKLTLQPIRLLYPGELLRLSIYSNYSSIESHFNQWMDRLNATVSNLPSNFSSFKFPYLDNWSLLRIDYAVNYTTPFKKAYLTLLNHGNIPKGFSKNKCYDTSLYLCSKNVNINFYDKHAHLVHKSNASSSILINSQNILRFEIQCKNKEIQRIKKKFNLSASILSEFWNTSIASYIIKKRLAAIIGKQDFYCLSTAKILLENAIHSRKLYCLCYNILKKAMITNNLTQLKKEFCIKYHCSENYYDQLLTKIHSAGINLLPLDLTPDVSRSHMPNPYKIINTENDM